MSFICLLVGCSEKKSDEAIESSTSTFTFFVAGHTYGNPMEFQLGLHPPFVEHIDYMNSMNQIEFGVFTGDVVPKPTNKYWDAAEKDIEMIEVPTYIAPGNHDQSEVFYERYPPRSTFENGNDRYVILKTNRWNIEGDELDYLLKCIDSLKSEKEKLFIFTHEVVWWTPNGEFSDLEPNYRPAYPGVSNFWDEVYPVLDSLPNKVYMFSGDVGASEQVTPFHYKKSDNLHFFSSGMGSNKWDNLLFVDTNQDYIKVDLFHLNSSQFIPLGKF